ncbi:hypothetical protein HAX54_046035 [Datura stramonium]|uniref:Uncharacterized protein n=1 Tax=Datura stramonium TaxID=4076 RepID=A0ABS8WGE1_DATST|nr:hypothetical protein [Datura stramonium]
MRYQVTILRILVEVRFTYKPAGIANYLSPMISPIDRRRMDSDSTKCLLNNCVHVATKGLQRLLKERVFLQLKSGKHEETLTFVRDQSLLAMTLTRRSFELEMLNNELDVPDRDDNGPTSSEEEFSITDGSGDSSSNDFDG